MLSLTTRIKLLLPKSHLSVGPRGPARPPFVTAGCKTRARGPRRCCGLNMQPLAASPLHLLYLPKPFEAKLRSIKIKNTSVFILSCKIAFLDWRWSELLWELIRSMIFSNFFTEIGVGPFPLWDAKSIPAHKLARALKDTFRHTHLPKHRYILTVAPLSSIHSKQSQLLWSVERSSHIDLDFCIFCILLERCTFWPAFLLFCSERQNTVASLGWRWRCACRREVGQLLWPLRAPSGQCGGFSFRSAGLARRSKLLYNRSYSQ